MTAREQAIEVMRVEHARHIYHANVDCCECGSKRIGGWIRHELHIESSVLDALLAATQEQTGEPLVLVGPELVAYHDDQRSPYWFNEAYIKENASVFARAYPVYRRAGSPDA